MNSNPVSIPKWNGDYSSITIEGMPYEDYLIQNMGKSFKEVHEYVEINKDVNSWINEFPQSFTLEEAFKIADSKTPGIPESHVERVLKQCGFEEVSSENGGTKQSKDGTSS